MVKRQINLDPKLLTNPDKILFPKSKITKKELADYYSSVAHLMLPFTQNRLLTMQRFPDGITGEGFYQKNIGDYFPDWIDYAPIKNADGSTTNYVIANNPETFTYLAYQAVITFHLWLSKADKIMYPDKIVIDLDPGKNTTFEMVKKYALIVHDTFAQRGITTFVMTTGSKGIHVVAPIIRRYTFDQVHEYTHNLARELVKQYPDSLTLEIRKDKRKGKLFVDYIRNTFGQTSVAPYSVRPIEDAPVATPVTWDEVADKKLTAQSYTIRNVEKRLEKHHDVWKNYYTTKNSLKIT